MVKIRLRGWPYNDKDIEDQIMSAVYTILAFIIFLAALNLLEKGRVD